MILCCGESLIDMLPRTLETGEAAFLPVSGGAVFNTAIALGRLGEKTGFFCGISSDMFGQMLIASLEQSGVDHSLCPRPARPTTLAFVTLVDGHAKYAFYDENTALRMLTPADLPSDAALAAVKAAQFGAISLIGEPCGTAFEALCNRLKDRAVISLDPNVRPGFVRDEAAYRGGSTGCCSRPTSSRYPTRTCLGSRRATTSRTSPRAGSATARRSSC